MYIVPLIISFVAQLILLLIVVDLYLTANKKNQLIREAIRLKEKIKEIEVKTNALKRIFVSTR